MYQEEICNVSQALLQGKRAAEWLKQQQNILGQKQKDLTALLEQRKLLEMQIGRLRQNLQRSQTDQSESAADSSREIQI